jgi:hypothetical protein
MKKSKNITKYEPQWQITRAALKGKYNDNLEYKFSFVDNYFKQTLSFDRWERIYNWTEGLQKGFKNRDAEKVAFLEGKLEYLQGLKPNENNVDCNIDYDILEQHEDKARVALFKDLVKRNIVWLKGGYYNVELNDFIDIVFSYIIDSDKILLQVKSLQHYREQSSKIKCTYKFIFI